MSLTINIKINNVSQTHIQQCESLSEQPGCLAHITSGSRLFGNIWSGSNREGWPEADG